MSSYRWPYAENSETTAAVMGIATSPPIQPNRATPTTTEPNATAGWTSIVRLLSRGTSR